MTRQPSGLVLRPRGDLDLATARAFRQAVQAVLVEEPSWLVLDFAEVTFLDSSGLAVLAVALRSQVARDGRLAITNPRPAVRRTIELVGFEVLLDVSDLPSALVEGLAAGPGDVV